MWGTHGHTYRPRQISSNRSSVTSAAASRIRRGKLSSAVVKSHGKLSIAGVSARLGRTGSLLSGVALVTGSFSELDGPLTATCAWARATDKLSGLPDAAESLRLCAFTPPACSIAGGVIGFSFVAVVVR